MDIMTNEIIYQHQIQELKATHKNISKAFFANKTFNPTPLEAKALHLANICNFEICEVSWDTKKVYVLYSLILERYMYEKIYNYIDEFLVSCSVSQIEDIPTMLEAYCIDYGLDYDKLCDKNILDIEQCFIDKISNSDFKKLKSEVEKLQVMITNNSDFNQLKSEVEKHHQAIIKTMDFSLALQKKISDLQEDSFLNAQHIQVIKNTHQMQIDKIYNILRKHIINTDNFIVEFAEKYDKENKQKGFICRFFDKIAKFFGTISNSAEPNTSILKSQLSNETIPQNSSECQVQTDSNDESNESTHTRRKP